MNINNIINYKPLHNLLIEYAACLQKQIEHIDRPELQHSYDEHLLKLLLEIMPLIARCMPHTTSAEQESAFKEAIHFLSDSPEVKKKKEDINLDCDS